MNKKSKIIAVSIATAGILLGVGVCGSTVFADQEASSMLTGGAAVAGFAVPVADYIDSGAEDTAQNVADVIQSVKSDMSLTPNPNDVEAAARAAVETDPREEVLNQYQNLGVVSDVNNYLNVREEPSTEAEIIGKVLKFGGVEIIEDTGDGWYKISSSQVTGYVSAEFIVTGEEAETLAVEHARRQLMVTADCLNVREEASTDSRILTQITLKERYDIVEEMDGWTKITFGMSDDGEEMFGYVSQDYSITGYYLDEAIEFHPVSAEDKFRQDIANFALQYLGGRYVWGGTTLGVGVDCSGFMQSVYANFGIYLSRCSYEQVNNGTHISAAEMRPGDLVFYVTNGSSISHVGMYIGNGQIIHACSPERGIIISAYNYRTPAAIVNVIGD